MHHLDPDFDLESYRFELPPGQIAQHPSPRREDSRLLTLERSTGKTSHGRFPDLVESLPSRALLVANSSRVLPARIKGHRPKTGGQVEFLLLTPLPLVEVQGLTGQRQSTVVQGLLRSSKPMAIGQQASFPGGLELTVLHRQGYGKIQAQLTWSGRLEDIFQAYGHMPLPPYIRREDEPKDRDRYQTVYAAQDQPGSVAAPTAGLHFSTEILSALKEKGVDWVELTLHVGYGTFSPVRCQDIRQHEMHPEYVELGAEAAACITRAQIEGRPIVALGTTSVRALEGIALECGQIQPFAGWIDIFIYPGFPFRVVDHLLTNFHLPGSSLILMASALAGRKTLLAVYKQAVAQGYRFFSYGDAMLIL